MLTHREPWQKRQVSSLLMWGSKPHAFPFGYASMLPGFPGVCLLNAPTSAGGGAGMKAPTRF